MLALRINPDTFDESDARQVREAIIKTFNKTYEIKDIQSALLEIVFSEQNEVLTFPDDHFEGM